MTINYNKCLEVATKQAANAKPGFLKVGDKMYTFEFDHNQGHYIVYEDLFFYVNFNTKVLATAKKYLKEYLAN